MIHGVQSVQRLGLLIILSVFLIVSGCAANKTVKVGIENNFRPFTYTEGGENKGFEVELWKAIANKANIKYELVPMEFRELNKGLESGKIDLAIAGMTVNDARKSNNAFSDPYFETGLVVLTASDNGQIKGKDDLVNKVVATKNGSTAYTYASDIQGIKIRGFSNISDAYNELKNNAVDAVIFDERNAHDFLQNTGEGKAKMVGEVLNKENYAIVAKKRNKYIGRINEAIATVSKDGTYEVLYTKWFGAKPEKLPSKMKDELNHVLEED